MRIIQNNNHNFLPINTSCVRMELDIKWWAVYRLDTPSQLWCHGEQDVTTSWFTAHQLLIFPLNIMISSLLTAMIYTPLIAIIHPMTYSPLLGNVVPTFNVHLPSSLRYTLRCLNYSKYLLYGAYHYIIHYNTITRQNFIKIIHYITIT